ncbi:hypothetical protein DFH06DRAFT_1121377 [Mycena polygramma]|nr:hypothetical protein DFH06DRAFT_1121377 [Mycena polygramma]
MTQSGCSYVRGVSHWGTSAWKPEKLRVRKVAENKKSIEARLLRKARRQARTAKFRQQTLIENSTFISQVLLQQHRMQKLDSLVGDVHRNAQSFRTRGAGEWDIAPYRTALDKIKAEKAVLDEAGSDGRASGRIGVSFAACYIGTPGAAYAAVLVVHILCIPPRLTAMLPLQRDPTSLILYLPYRPPGPRRGAAISIGGLESSLLPRDPSVTEDSCTMTDSATRGVESTSPTPHLGEAWGIDRRLRRGRGAGGPDICICQLNGARM